MVRSNRRICSDFRSYPVYWGEGLILKSLASLVLAMRLVGSICRRKQFRGGFTLVELLVVIAVIGVLVSLLLPAVQGARESARRIQCQNQVKQIALAIHGYESHAKKLPAAGSFAPPAEAVKFSYQDWRVDLRSGTNYSWLVEILPQLEETALCDSLDRKQHITASPAVSLAAQPAVLLCPSDESRGRMFQSADTFGVGPARFGKANYAAYTNPFHVDSFYRSGPIAMYGMKMGKATDGTAKTLLVSEVRTRDNERDQRGAWMLPWAASSLLAMDLHPAYYGKATEEEANALTFGPDTRSLGFTQTPNSAMADVLYECPDLADAQFEALPCNDAFYGYISAAPRSLHVGGVNVAFLDGHVTFLPNEIDELTMHYLISVADGEVIEGSY
jgi:prepilin-type N-terminal cleavage/methylation domain-containing protein/prepilin-type processing-associated H-X9-DG protein